METKPKDANTEKSNEITKELTKDYPEKDWRPTTITSTNLRHIIYTACLQMAEAKDLALKRFLIEYISPGVKVEMDENGEPLAESFIAAGEARLKAADEVYNRYKHFEERML